MLIRDKSGGPLLQAELEEPLGGSGASTLVADNGRKSFEIDCQHAKQFYRLISATKREVDLLKKNPEFMAFLKERAQERAAISLQELRKELGV